MDNVRIFLGTYIDLPEFNEQYREIRKDFKHCCFGKWVEPENLHFTYHFIGEINRNIGMKMKVALKDYLRNYKSEISLNGLGFFPDEIHPKLMHVNIIDNDKILEKIHKETEQMFIKFGYKQEKRVFTPHLTLVRIRDVNYSIFEKVILKYKNYDFGTLDNFSVDIIESKLTSQGPIYNIF